MIRLPVWFDSSPQVLVQGITGREARYWTERMLAYGTRIVAGVTPNKGGSTVEGVRVYDSVDEACTFHEISISVVFVPPRATLEAVSEAINAGISAVVILTEYVPVHDAMTILHLARTEGTEILGPNSPGLVRPGSWFVGLMPAWKNNMFKLGTVGIASRSGSLAASVSTDLIRLGLGQSLLLGLGGDPVVGYSFRQALQDFELDDATKVIVILGEPGGFMEEDAASFVSEMTKPVIAYIAGKHVPLGKRMGHAGALVNSENSTAAAKSTDLEDAGAYVCKLPSGIAGLARELLPLGA